MPAIQSVEQLGLHSLRWLRPPENFSHHVGPRWEVGLEDWFTSTAHVGEHGLLKVPAQQGIDDMSWIVRLTTRSTQDHTLEFPSRWTKGLHSVTIIGIDSDVVTIPQIMNVRPK